MGERTRLVEALGRLDENIAQALKDLQALTRPDERELFESRLIILQVRVHAIGFMPQALKPIPDIPVSSVP